MVEDIPKSENSEKLVRIVTIIFGIVLLAVVITIKYNVPTFSLGLFIIIIVLIIVLAVAIIWGFHYIQKSKLLKTKEEENLKKLPPAVTVEQAREIAIKATQNSAYADYIMGCLGEDVQQIGKGVKSHIYTYRGRGKYQKDIYVIVMNMHFPNQMRTILINPSELKIAAAANALANYPEDQPSIKETITENPLLGTKQIIKEINRENKEAQEEKKEEKKDI